MGRYGDREFALQLALQKGKRASPARHDCKARRSAGSALQELGELVLVALQRRLHLRQVVPAIVDARDRGERCCVAEQSLDDVRRRDLPFRALGRKRPAQIMHGPTSHAAQLIELAFVEAD